MNNSRKIKFPHIVVLTTIFMILIAPSELIFKTEKIYYILCFIPLILWFVYKGLNIRKDYSISILLYLLYMMFSTTWSPNPNALNSCFIKCVTILFLYLQIQYTYNTEEYETIKKMFLLQFVVLLVIIICFNYIDWDGRLWIANNDLKTDSNSICSWLVIPLIYSFECFFCEKNKKRIIYLSLILINIVVLFYLGTRAGLVSFLICIFIIVLHNTKKEIQQHPIKSLFVFLLGLLSIYIIYIELPPSFVYRLSNANVSSLGGRTGIWRELILLLHDNPIKVIFGFGESSTIYLTGHVAHNLFLEILFNQGVIGLLLILFYIIKASILLYRSRYYTLIALLGLMIISASLSEFTSRPVMLIFFLAGANVNRKSEEPSLS